MPFDEQIKKAAEMVWHELSKRKIRAFARGDSQFSPQNICTIEALFDSEQTHGGIEVIESLLVNGRNDFSKLGAYIGEIVRENIKGCEWNGDATKQEGITMYVVPHLQGLSR